MANLPYDSRSGRPAGPRLGLRLRVFLRRWRLDRDLAAEDAPPGDEAHRLRTRQLLDESFRSDLARALVGIAELIEEGAFTSGPSDPEAVAARQAVLALAERLSDVQPVSACGMARAALIADRYVGLAADMPLSDMAGAADRARSALDEPRS